MAIRFLQAPSKGPIAWPGGLLSLMDDSPVGWASESLVQRRYERIVVRAGET